MDHVSDQTRRIAAYIADARHLDLPESVAERGKMHLLDAVGSIVSGSTMPAGERGRVWLEFAYGKAVGPATVIGSGTRAAIVPAALANGMSAHADETDDSHAPSLSHPGCSIGPTVLAVGEALRASGADVLRAFVAGYDVGCRIGRAVGSATRIRNVGTWSSHAVIGTFCSAAAAGSLFSLSEVDACYLLSYTGHLASGVTSWMRDTHHIEKAFVFAGMPASQGVLAASLVASGCDGVDDEFSGSPSWIEAASTSPNLDMFSDGLGQRFEIMDATVKKYAVGSPSQAAVEGIVELLAEGLTASDIESITVWLPTDSAFVVDGRSMPNVNVQYLVAATLLDGGFSFKMSHDETRLADPSVIALMDRIHLEGDATLAGTRSARLAIQRRGDKSPSMQRYVSDVRGTPKNPMSPKEVRTKAIDLMSDVLGSDRTTRACDLIESIESVTDINELTVLLTAQPQL